MEKLNIAEILKDCPSGMVLDCTMYDNATLLGVDNIDSSTYPIQIHIGDERTVKLSKYGEYIETKFAKCVIFPKGKTTWEGFQRPFKDGDVVSVTMFPEGIWIGIFKQYKETFFETYCSLNTSGVFNITAFKNHSLIGIHLATEEEKEKLSQAIKDNGYKWNPETKTLEKLIVPKFRIGDRIKHKLTGDVCKILFVLSNGYDGGVYDVAITNEIGKSIDIKEQDEYELLPNKFDISTLVPFESRVLVRDNSSEEWCPAIWGLKTDEIYNYPYIVVGGWKYNCCIPYESNEHLLGTTNDCDEYYKTWE